MLKECALQGAAYCAINIHLLKLATAGSYSSICHLGGKTPARLPSVRNHDICGVPDAIEGHTQARPRANPSRQTRRARQSPVAAQRRKLPDDWTSGRHKPQKARPSHRQPNTSHTPQRHRQAPILMQAPGIPSRRHNNPQNRNASSPSAMARGRGTKINRFYFDFVRNH